MTDDIIEPPDTPELRAAGLTAPEPNAKPTADKGGGGKSKKGKKKKTPAPELAPIFVPPPPLVVPPAPAPAAAPSMTSFVLNVVLAVAAVGLAAALVVSLVTRGGGGGGGPLDATQTGALAVGRTYALDLASYDYRHLQQEFGVVLAHSTPTFRKSYQESSSALASTLTKFHATATAKVVAEGIVSETATQATVLVFVDQTVTNSTQKAPTVDRSQLEITLVQSGGSWLIDQVTLL
jgi:hypothetical protein